MKPITPFFLALWLGLPIAVGALVSTRIHRETTDLQVELAALKERAAFLERSAALPPRAASRAEMAEPVLVIPRASPERVELDRALKLLQSRPAATSSLKQDLEDELAVNSHPGRNYYRKLLYDPEYAQAVGVLQRQRSERRFGRLFAALNLPPEKQAKLEDILVERFMIKEDVAGLASDVDLDQRRALKTTAMRDLKGRIVDELGAEVAKKVKEYSFTYELREAVDRLETRLGYTATPLQPAQYDQVFALLIRVVGPKVTTQYWDMPDLVLTQATTVLSAPQLNLLKQIQEEQRSLALSHDLKVGGR